MLSASPPSSCSRPSCAVVSCSGVAGQLFPLVGFSSSLLHSAPPSSSVSWSLRTCVVGSRPFGSAGFGSVADQRSCCGCSDGGVDTTTTTTRCVSAGVGVSPVVPQALSFAASVGSLAPLESVTHVGVRGPHPSAETPCLMAQV